jgi:ABC-type branched-subunit amino acid transport system permease subunit
MSLGAVRARRAWAAAGLAGAAALAALPFFANPYLVATGLTLLMWLALTQSWCVLSKLTGYVSLGHVVFYGLGAYLVVVTWQQWPLPARDRRGRRAGGALRGADRPAGAARARARTS